MKIEVSGTRANIEVRKLRDRRHAGVRVDGRPLLDPGEPDNRAELELIVRYDGLELTQ